MNQIIFTSNVHFLSSINSLFMFEFETLIFVCEQFLKFPKIFPLRLEILLIILELKMIQF